MADEYQMLEELGSKLSQGETYTALLSNTSSQAAPLAPYTAPCTNPPATT